MRERWSEDAHPFPVLTLSTRRTGGNDDGFIERPPIFLLADRMHRPQLPKELINQRTQPRPRRAVRE